MKLVDSINFVAFYDKIKDQAMPVATAYKLSKIYKQVKEDETFYHDKLRAILLDCGELDEQGNLIPTEDNKGVKIKPDKQQDCIDAINDLQEIESTITFEPISLSVLDGLEVTPSDLDGVIGFFE